MKHYRSFVRVTKLVVVAILCLTFFLSALQTGCTKEEADPAKRMLSKAVKSMGGMKKAQGWSTRIEKGILISVRPGWGTMKANCTRTVEKPDKVKIDYDYSAYDHPFYQTFYYNGGDAWYVVNLNTRQHPRITSQLQEFMERVDGLAYYLAECDTFFQVVHVPPDTLLEGLPIERAGCVHQGDTILFDFNRETHLLVQKIDNKGTRQSIYSNYTKTGGMKLPFHITVYQNGRKSEEFMWEAITFNERIDPSVFEEDRPPAREESDETG